MFKIFAQLAKPGDPTANPSITWPDDRPKVELGTLSIETLRTDSAEIERKLIFDPLNPTDGIELSDGHLPIDRSEIYALSYARRNP